MAKSASWDMNSLSPPIPLQSDFNQYPSRFKRADSEIRGDQLEEDADFDITISGPGTKSRKQSIKLFDNLFSTINPTKSASYWKKHKLVFVDVPSFRVKMHNTLEDAVGKGVDVENIAVIIKKIPLSKRIVKIMRKTLKIKSGGFSRRKR